MAKLPDPPAELKLAAAIQVLRGGAVLYRVYFRAGRTPMRWNDFRFFGPTAARFDHHDPPPAVQPKGILYAARHPTTCVAEVFQATRLVDRSRNDPWLVGFEVLRDLRLLDLTGPWPTRAGASMAIASGPRSRARAWSRAIHAVYPAVDGLLYPSSMNANQPAVALYERARSALATAPTFHRALADPALLPRLNTAATRLGYGLA
jgi:hypothetical protein